MTGQEWEKRMGTGESAPLPVTEHWTAEEVNSDFTPSDVEEGDR